MWTDVDGGGWMWMDGWAVLFEGAMKRSTLKSLRQPLGCSPHMDGVERRGLSALGQFRWPRRQLVLGAWDWFPKRKLMLGSKRV